MKFSIKHTFKRVLLLVLVGVLSLIWSTPSLATLLGAYQWGTTVNQQAGTVNFKISLNETPDFLTQNNLGIDHQDFSIFIDANGSWPNINIFKAASTISTNNIVNIGGLGVYDGYFGTQKTIVTTTFGNDGGLINNVVTFTTSLNIINDPNGVFTYQLELYDNYGGLSGKPYLGQSNVNYVTTPLPCTILLFGSGVLGLAGLRLWKT
jgi:hypothetical protein